MLEVFWGLLVYLSEVFQAGMLEVFWGLLVYLSEVFQACWKCFGGC